MTRLEQITTQKGNNVKTRQQLGNEIRQARVQISKSNSQSQQQEREHEEAKLNKELADLQQRDKTQMKAITELGEKRELLGKDIEKLGMRNTKLNLDQKKIKVDIKSLEDQLRNTNSQSKMSRFSRDIQSLVRDIEANAARFKMVPIGPLARHIELSEEACTNDRLSTLLFNQGLHLS